MTQHTYVIIEGVVKLFQFYSFYMTHYENMIHFTGNYAVCNYLVHTHLSSSYMTAIYLNAS